MNEYGEREGAPPFDYAEQARVRGEQERLARVEWKLETGFQGVHRRLDVLNGQVARNTQWRQDHEIIHARADGVNDGEQALRKSTYAFLALLCAVASTAGGVIAQVVK